MPFASEKQRRYMWVHHPKIAQRWAHEGKKKRKPSSRSYSRASVREARKMLL